MTDTTVPSSLARIAEAARRLGPPDPADDGDELAEIMKDIDPAKLAAARAETQAYLDKIKAAELGRWSPELPELPDGSRIEFEYGTDVYAFWRDDEESALAGCTYGPGGVTWMEYGRSVPPVSWAVLCATYGEDVLAAGRRLLVHPEDVDKRRGWPTQEHKREILALAAERQRKALELTCDGCGEPDQMNWHDRGRHCEAGRRAYARGFRAQAAPDEAPSVG